MPFRRLGGRHLSSVSIPVPFAGMRCRIVRRHLPIRSPSRSWALVPLCRPQRRVPQARDVDAVLSRGAMALVHTGRARSPRQVPRALFSDGTKYQQMHAAASSVHSGPGARLRKFRRLPHSDDDPLNQRRSNERVHPVAPSARPDATLILARPNPARSPSPLHSAPTLHLVEHMKAIVDARGNGSLTPAAISFDHAPAPDPREDAWPCYPDRGPLSSAPASTGTAPGQNVAGEKHIFMGT